MTWFQKTVAFSALGITLFQTGCDKSQSNTANAPAGSAPSSTPPAAVTPAAADTATAMTELTGSYNAVSDVGDGSSLRRHQMLMLNADGTVMLDTSIVNPSTPNAAPKSSDHASGTYTAGAKEVVATFTLKDGKAIPSGDDRHVLKLTREKGNKSLMSEDGRTFERSK